MNNILTFEDYRKMNIRQVESVIYRQFIENTIKDEVNEGIIRKAINKAAGKFIQNALADEIEKGKELEKSIKKALDGLNEGIENIDKKISGDTTDDKDPKSKDTQIEKVKEAIKAVQSQAFDTLTMIGSEGEIDFAGFMGSASVIAAANFGILFSPIRSLFITRKAYKYFLGIIKQTIRRNLLVIQLNFDQFENLILQKSFEAEDSEAIARRDALHELFGKMEEQLFSPDSGLKVISGVKNIGNMKKYLEALKKAQDIEKNFAKNSPFSSLWQDQHNNTYTRTLEQLKQHINDDSQKELDALKNSITKMAGNDPDLLPYGELMISAAEEYAIHTNHGINNNFIKMSSVFNLDNQKKLIELIKAESESGKKEAEENTHDALDDIKKDTEDDKKRGEKIFDKLIGSEVENMSIDEFYKEYSEDDIKALKTFLTSEEGKEGYEKLIEKNPLFKYILMIDLVYLNNLLNSIGSLNVVEIPNSEDFYDTIVKEEQALYYMMADRSIKDAIAGESSDEYFGFDISSGRVNDDNILESKSIEEIYNFEAINEGQEKLKQVNRNKEAIEKLTQDLQKQQEVINDLLQKKKETEEEREKLADDRKKLQELIDKYNKLLNDVEIENKENYKEVVDDAKEEIENAEEYIGSDDVSKKPSGIDDILTKKLFPDDKTKRYFLTFDHKNANIDIDILFNILHKDFKTEMFSGDTYVKDISTDSKLNLLKIIHKVTNKGGEKDLEEQLSKCLVGYGTHMLLQPKDPWFVVKNNTELIETEKCFDKDSDETVNENAFIEINKDGYTEIKKFLDDIKKVNADSYSSEETEIE